MKRLLLAVLVVGTLGVLVNSADAGRYYRGGGYYGPAYYNTYRPVYGPAYYNTYRPIYGPPYGAVYGPAYPAYRPYRAYRGPQYYVPNRAWGAAPGGFYGGGFYLY